MLCGPPDSVSLSLSLCKEGSRIFESWDISHKKIDVHAHRRHPPGCNRNMCIKSNNNDIVVQARMCTSKSNSNHIYRTVCTPRVGEKLETQKQLDNDHDRFAVTVNEGKQTVGTHACGDFKNSW